MRPIPGDCAKCPGGDCSVKETCFRFVAESGNPLWQVQFIEPPEGGPDCEYYWPITEEPSGT